MQPDKYKQKGKSVLSYVREMDKLNRIAWSAPLVPLPKPFQNGWTKYFVLRDDYTRRDDAHIFKTILKKIGTEVFCRKTDFLNYKGEPYGPALEIIGMNEMDMLGWTAQHKKHFYYGIHERPSSYGYYSRVKITGYKMDRPFFFIENIKPHIVTHIKTHYPEVQQRLAELHNKFTNEQLWPKYYKMKGGRHFSQDWALAKARYLETVGTQEIEEYDQSEEKNERQ